MTDKSDDGDEYLSQLGALGFEFLKTKRKRKGVIGFLEDKTFDFCLARTVLNLS